MCCLWILKTILKLVNKIQKQDIKKTKKQIIVKIKTKFKKNWINQVYLFFLQHNFVWDTSVNIFILWFISILKEWLISVGTHICFDADYFWLDRNFANFFILGYFHITGKRVVSPCVVDYQAHDNTVDRLQWFLDRVRSVLQFRMLVAEVRCTDLWVLFHKRV